VRIVDNDFARNGCPAAETFANLWSDSPESCSVAGTAAIASISDFHSTISRKLSVFSSFTSTS
jgi:hypothetical protein